MRRSLSGGRGVVVAAVAGAAGLVAACGADGTAARIAASTTTTGTTATTTTVPMEATLPDGAMAVPLPYENGSVVATDAGVWVFPHLDPVGLRIDPATREVDLEIELPAPATAAAAGDGMLWIRTEADDQSYTRLDPETGAALARIAGIDADLAEVAYGRMWAAGGDGSVTRIDGGSNQVDRFPAQSGGPFFMTAAGGKLWTLGVDGLVGIDPDTGAATEPWRPITVLGERPQFLATAGEHVLLATPGGVHEVDPEGQALVRSVAAPPGRRPAGFARGHRIGDGQFVWLFDRYVDNPGPIVELPRGRTPDPVTVGRIDLVAGTVAATVEAPFPEGQTGAVAADGSVWLAPLRGTSVVRLEL